VGDHDKVILYAPLVDAWNNLEFYIDPDDYKIIGLSRRATEYFNDGHYACLPSSHGPSIGALADHKSIALKELKNRCVKCWEHQQPHHRGCLGVRETPMERFDRLGT
jgi:hypothetical protein